MTTHTTTEVRKMLNGDGNHYDVSDHLRTDNTRYFKVRGDADLLKTFKTLVRTATPFEVVDVEDWGDRFKAEIETESDGETDDGAEEFVEDVDPYADSVDVREMPNGNTYVAGRSPVGKSPGRVETLAERHGGRYDATRASAYVEWSVIFDSEKEDGR